jgi:hypothetical protein
MSKCIIRKKKMSCMIPPLRGCNYATLRNGGRYFSVGVLTLPAEHRLTLEGSGNLAPYFPDYSDTVLLKKLKKRHRAEQQPHKLS